MFFNEHDDDVVSLDIHPNGQIVATGQMAHANQAKFIDMNVWSLQTFKCLKNLKGFHRRAISVIKFNPKGDKLLSIGNDDNHSVAIYDWEKGTQVNAKVDMSEVFGAIWQNDIDFVTFGLKHVKFWNIKGT